MKIGPAARPFTALAAVPTVVAAVARRPRTTLGLGLLTLGVTLFFRDPDRTPDRSPVTDPDSCSPRPTAWSRTWASRSRGSPRRGLAAGQHLPVAARRAHEPHALWRPRRRRHPPAGPLPRRLQGRERDEERAQRAHVERSCDGRSRRIVFRQLVGMVARRIVTRIEPARAGDGRADRPDEVRLADGRLRAPEVVLEVTKGNAPSAERRCWAASRRRTPA